MTAGLAPLIGAVARLRLPQVQYSTILPELILIGGALVLMCIFALTRRAVPGWLYAGFTVAVSAAAVGASVWLWLDVEGRGPYTSIAGAIAVDGFSALFLVLVSSAMLLSALAGEGWLRRQRMGGPELYVLALLSASGAMFMAEANDLIIIFLGLEIMSIALYVLAGLNARRAESGEAAIKYFVLGAFSSAIFVYGIALVYGATGSTNLVTIGDYLAHNVIVSNGVLLAGLVLLLVGFAFKVAAVPFHTWTPDVYQGSPTPVTGFMAAVAKAGGFAGLLRVFFSSFHTLRLDWEPAIWVIAVLTLVVGAVLALVQRDIKRMLAYSSINHAGFVLLGLQAATVTGISSSLYYLFVYSFMVIGSFAVVSVIGRDNDGAHDLDQYRGLVRRRPYLAAALALLLIAQAGVPFTTGFLAKFYVVTAAVESRSYALAVIAMVSAAVAAFFYLRVIFYMYNPIPRPGLAEEAPGEIGPVPQAVAASMAGGDGVPVTALAAAGAPGLGGLAPGGLVGGLPAGAVPREGGASSVPEVAPVEELSAMEAGRRSLEWVPATIAVVVAVTVAFTVVFGVWPAPVVDFAHKATLLF